MHGWKQDLEDFQIPKFLVARGTSNLVMEKFYSSIVATTYSLVAATTYNPVVETTYSLVVVTTYSPVASFIDSLATHRLRPLG